MTAGPAAGGEGGREGGREGGERGREGREGGRGGGREGGRKGGRREGDRGIRVDGQCDRPSHLEFTGCISDGDTQHVLLKHWVFKLLHNELSESSPLLCQQLQHQLLEFGVSHGTVSSLTNFNMQYWFTKL
jgi:hypothetical protein